MGGGPLRGGKLGCGRAERTDADGRPAAVSPAPGDDEEAGTRRVGVALAPGWPGEPGAWGAVPESDARGAVQPADARAADGAPPPGDAACCCPHAVRATVSNTVSAPAPMTGATAGPEREEPCRTRFTPLREGANPPR